MENRKSIDFVLLLRTIACVSVVWSHWCMMFFTDTASELGLFEKSNVLLDWIPIWWPAVSKATEYHFGFGAFGVAIFFLICGFLTPNSIKRTPEQYIKRRFIRLWPTYIVGMGITICTLIISSKANNIIFPYSLLTIIENISFFRLFFMAPSIDGVIWTTECIVFFSILIYIIMSLNERFLTKKAGILCVGGMLTITNILISINISAVVASVPRLYGVCFWLCHNAVYCSYMLCGIVIRYIFDKKWSILSGGGLLIGVFLYFLINTYVFYPDMLVEYQVNYGLAIVIFLFFSHVQCRIYRSRVIKFIADISFPFYIIHGAGGYATLAMLCRVTGNYYISLLITLCIYIIMATLLHTFVENRIGKFFNQSFALILGKVIS